MSAPVSFARDIRPLFEPYRAPMRWRLDMTSYDEVRTNAELIYGQIAGKSMPPGPFAPLTDAQIAEFKRWMDDGYLP